VKTSRKKLRVFEPAGLLDSARGDHNGSRELPQAVAHVSEVRSVSLPPIQPQRYWNLHVLRAAVPCLNDRLECQFHPASTLRQLIVERLREPSQLAVHVVQWDI